MHFTRKISAVKINNGFLVVLLMLCTMNNNSLESAYNNKKIFYPAKSLIDNKIQITGQKLLFNFTLLKTTLEEIHVILKMGLNKSAYDEVKLQKLRVDGQLLNHKVAELQLELDLLKLKKQEDELPIIASVSKRQLLSRSFDLYGNN